MGGASKVASGQDGKIARSEGGVDFTISLMKDFGLYLAFAFSFFLFIVCCILPFLLSFTLFLLFYFSLHCFVPCYLFYSFILFSFFVSYFLNELVVNGSFCQLFLAFPQLYILLIIQSVIEFSYFISQSASSQYVRKKINGKRTKHRKRKRQRNKKQKVLRGTT